MKVSRKEIMPHVFLTCLHTDKFKTGCLSVTLISQLRRENAAKNAALPRVLRRGSTAYPDMESISAALDESYGATVEPLVRKLGELQCSGFYTDFIDDRFASGGRILEKAAAMTGELLLHPNTRGGLFLPQYVDSERAKLTEQIRSRINDKRSYSLSRLFELMCFSEDYAVDRLGDEDEAESINYTRLTRHYRDLLATSPAEVFYCGSADPIRVERAVHEALVSMPRGEPDEELGTDIRLNTIEESERYFTEEMDVTQGKLTMGFRLGECMEDCDAAAIRVFNAVYGGSVTSKLFMNVREKLSLCYYASSMVDLQKGLMAVSSGVEFDKYEAAKAEIFAQLDCVRAGDITDDELEAARKYVASSLRTAMDSPAALESFYLAQNVKGLEYGPEELAALAEGVTKDQVVEIARSVRCDAVYFLRGSEVC